MAEIHSSQQQFMKPPIGYKFIPSDEELVLYYLIPKVAKRPLPVNIIYEVELKDYNPEKLTENYEPQGGNILYIFTQRDRKYKNGERPNRIAGDGYWKASGSKYDVMHNGMKIGSKNSLVFRRGKHPNGKKTNWIMYEYTVHRPSRQPRQRENQNDMRLHEWVLCTIHKNHRRKRTNKDVDDDSNGYEENPTMAQPLYQSTVNSDSYNSPVEHNNGVQNNYMMLYQPSIQTTIDAISYNAHLGQSNAIHCNNMMLPQPPKSNIHHVHRGNVIQDYCTLSSQPPNQNVMNPIVEDISMEDYNKILFESQEQNVTTLSVPLNQNVTDSDTVNNSDFPEQNNGFGEGSFSSTIDDWLSNLQEPPADPMDKICSSLCA